MALSPNKPLEWIVGNQISKEFFFLSAMPQSVDYRPKHVSGQHQIHLFSPNQCFCIGKNLPNFDLKIMILSYTKDFSLKKLPKIVRFFEEKNSKLPDFSHNLQKVAKNIGGILFFS
jgi:hypothetical protein